MRDTSSFTSAFDYSLTREPFLTAIAYITQKPLQLESFSLVRCETDFFPLPPETTSSSNSTNSRTGSTERDMRLEMVVLLCSLALVLPRQREGQEPLHSLHHRPFPRGGPPSGAAHSPNLRHHLLRHAPGRQQNGGEHCFWFCCPLSSCSCPATTTTSPRVCAPSSRSTFT